MHNNIQNEVLMNLKRQELERSSRTIHCRYDAEEARRRRTQRSYAPLLATMGRLLIRVGNRLERRYSRELVNARQTMENLVVDVRSARRSIENSSY